MSGEKSTEWVDHAAALAQVEMLSHDMDGYSRAIVQATVPEIREASARGIGETWLLMRPHLWTLGILPRQRKEEPGA